MPTSSTSRRTLLGLTGLVALLTGAGAAHWFKLRNRLPADAEKALWQHTFSLVDGQELTLSEWQGHPIVINFWATWCPPCVEEMPLLDVFYQQNASKGWKMLGIAIDQPSQVKRFLAQRPFSYTMAHGGLDGMQLGEMLGNESGSLPFTVVLAADGRLIQRKLGKLSANEIQKWG